MAQYTRIADHLLHEGFFPRAAALYKKILKITPDDEAAQLQLGEISARSRGCSPTPRRYFSVVAERRRARGDQAGADEMVVRLGSARSVRLRRAVWRRRRCSSRAATPSPPRCSTARMHADLIEKGRPAEAMAALREAVRLNPDDNEGRAELARAARRGRRTRGRQAYLDARDRPASDPAAAVRAAGDRAALRRDARRAREI